MLLTSAFTPLPMDTYRPALPSSCIERVRSPSLARCHQAARLGHRIADAAHQAIESRGQHFEEAALAGERSMRWSSLPSDTAATRSPISFSAATSCVRSCHSITVPMRLPSPSTMGLTMVCSVRVPTTNSERADRCRVRMRSRSRAPSAKKMSILFSIRSPASKRRLHRAEILARAGHELLRRRVQVDDLALLVADHDVDRRGIQRLADALARHGALALLGGRATIRFDARRQAGSACCPAPSVACPARRCGWPPSSLSNLPLAMRTKTALAVSSLRADIAS